MKKRIEPKISLEVGAEFLGKSYFYHWCDHKQNDKDILLLTHPSNSQRRNETPSEGFPPTPLPPEVLKILKPDHLKLVKSGAFVHIEPWPVIKCREAGHRVYGMWANALNIPVKDSTLNQVIAQNVFGAPYSDFEIGMENDTRSFNNVRNALNEFHRALKPGGQIIIAEHYTPYATAFSEIEKHLNQLGYTITKERGLKRAASEAYVFTATKPLKKT